MKNDSTKLGEKKREFWIDTIFHHLTYSPLPTPCKAVPFFAFLLSFCFIFFMFF